MIGLSMFPPVRIVSAQVSHHGKVLPNFKVFDELKPFISDLPSFFTNNINRLHFGVESWISLLFDIVQEKIHRETDTQETLEHYIYEMEFSHHPHEVPFYPINGTSFYNQFLTFARFIKCRRINMPLNANEIPGAVIELIDSYSDDNVIHLPQTFTDIPFLHQN